MYTAEVRNVWGRKGNIWNSAGATVFSGYNTLQPMFIKSIHTITSKVASKQNVEVRKEKNMIKGVGNIMK